MSEIKNIPFEDESADIKETVVGYWSKRAESFAIHKHAEIHSEKVNLWRNEFQKLLPEKKELSILDVGCGSGFFEAVLSPLGYKVTGIDLTPEMIGEGKKLLERHNIDAELMLMDAENPTFPEESFDVIVTRNLVWTLPHPLQAYEKWYRLLKKGGKLLVFDAEYAKGFHKYNWGENRAHSEVNDAMKEECHKIYHMLSISSFDRPKWDVEVMEKLGFSEVMTDISVGDRIYATKDEFYMPDRMFGIYGLK
ncbi:class I SAM-dependent methyltransferase [Butyrivibrio sp. LC3010]|uniref:class I SAM-dependent methyltransferase n=1 Tax=Butyrivibrio sp. LC3010 TaxID=1280680 RepID=UPI000425DEBA|nr:class I SAM-dependent methyltransferase [Butyrivibrio sp. LC3010]